MADNINKLLKQEVNGFEAIKVLKELGCNKQYIEKTMGGHIDDFGDFMPIDILDRDLDSEKYTLGKLIPKSKYKEFNQIVKSEGGLENYFHHKDPILEISGHIPIKGKFSENSLKNAYNHILNQQY